MENMGISCGRSQPGTVRDVSRITPIKPSDFHFLRVIGTGNYSHVHLTRLFDSPVAVKVMNKSHLLEQHQLSHIFTEKRVLQLVKSPFVVGLIGTCQDELNLYCVLEYAAGGELFRLMVRKDTLTKKEAQFYLAEVVQALSHLHAIKCLYRDLKPENVLLAGNGHVKLGDLGFAKLLLDQDRTYTLCGTPEYLAPELITGAGCGLELDWWQVGALLYEMLSGKTPFADANPYRLYEKILTSTPNLSLPCFDPDSKQFISSLLIKNPAHRISQAQIYQHPFFQDINWKNLLDMKPPFIPAINDPFDAGYFETFSERHSEARLEGDQNELFSEY